MHPSLTIALEHHQAGRLAAAEALYRQVLAAEPNNADALHFLGVLAHDLGRNEEAIELIERAHRQMRPQPFSLTNLGVAYLASHRPREAKRCFAKALALKPDYAEAHGNLGDALDALGQLKDAERSYRRALAIKPDRAIAHYSLGNLLRRLGRWNEAEHSYREALVRAPEFAEAQNNLGLVLGEMERPEEAAQSFREAIRINPRHLWAHHHLGIVQESLGRLEEAERSYRAALALDPAVVEPSINLGNVLQRLERHDEAEAVLRRALTVRPDMAVIHYNLANVLSSIDRQEEAARAYRQAIALEPEFASARWALAMAHPPLVLATREESERCRAAFSAELDALIDWFAANPSGDAGVIVAHPFRLAYQEEESRELLARYGELSAGIMRKWLAQQPQPPVRQAKKGPVRIGVMSAHVYEQSVWTAIVKGWLKCLDRDRFELDVYHLGYRHDHETALAASQASHFEQGPKTLSEWVHAIAERPPDVLMYPEIGMNIMTARLASLRLAPVQVASWGHPETTGLPTLDHYLSAELFEPPGAQAHYTERLVALPNLGCFFDEAPVVPIDPDCARLGIDEQSPLFVCAGTPFKYSPLHDWVYPAIARSLGQCQFVFFTFRVQQLSDKLRRRLRGVFERSGLDFDRHVRFIPWQSRPEFYSLLKRADALLDTIGFSGFNTAMQAVECGLPIVTREGRFMRGRLASGVLRRLELEELIAASEEQYVALAVKLARDAEYRARIGARMDASRKVLYEDQAPIRALEAFLSSVTGR